MSPEPIVALEGVHVARGERMVLRDIHLQIEAGEHLVILGPNGCGKSTLLKTLTCELYPLRPALRGVGLAGELTTQPRVRLFGRERWDVTQLRRKMGVVSAELPGEPTRYITGYDAILTGFYSSSKLWPNLDVTTAMRDRAEELLHLLRAESLRDVPVGEMSAGQQRRIMIARALAGNSDEHRMLLLDEPSNALDLAAQQDLRETLRTLARAGVAILMITHHVNDILPEMGRIVLMREGRIVADGAKEALLTASGLTQLFGREIQLVQRDGVYFAW